jgi:hypothetical protein
MVVERARWEKGPSWYALSFVRVSMAFALLAWLTACVTKLPPSHQVSPTPAAGRDLPATGGGSADSGGAAAPSAKPPPQAPPRAAEHGPATKPSARPLVVRNHCDDSAPPVVPASSLYVVVGADPSGPVAASLGLDTTLEVSRHEGEELTLWLSRDEAGRQRKMVVAPSTNELDVGCRAIQSR